MNRITRRSLLAAAPVIALPIPGLNHRRSAAAAVLRRLDGGPAWVDAFPAHSADAVRAVVGASHAQLDVVTELVTGRPELAKAAWDWGFGDWETALGAASHTGRRDIAEILIRHGARADLFSFAMLGQVDVVRACCTANPGIQRTPGPHGINLMRHALAGGEAATAVVEYLTELGDADMAPTNLALDETAATMYLGTYESPDAPGAALIVKWNTRQKCLTLQRDEQAFRVLLNEGNHRFHPAGAPSVDVLFAIENDRAVELTIRDGDLLVRARPV